MNTFKQFKSLQEATGKVYDSGVGYTARVISKDGKHVAKFFKNGQHMQDADYEHKDSKDVHEFARDEMEYRKNSAQKNESIDPKDHIETSLANRDINSKVDGNSVQVHKSNLDKAKRLVKRLGYSHTVKSGLNEETLDERNNMPQGHKETPDPISDDSSSDNGRVKKMMGNRTPLNIIATILAKRKSK